MVGNSGEIALSEKPIESIGDTDIDTTPREDEEIPLSLTEKKIAKKSLNLLRFYRFYQESRDKEAAYHATFPESQSGPYAQDRGNIYLKRIDSLLGYRDIMSDEKLSDRDLAVKGEKLLRAESEHVQARVLDSMVKARGWHRDVGADHSGVQIVIMRSDVREGDDLMPAQKVYDPAIEYAPEDEETGDPTLPVAIVD